MAERTRRSRSSGASSSRRSRSEAASNRLNRDYSGEEYREPSEGYNGEEPTKGLYTAELVSVREHTSQDGNESLKWLFRLAEGSENKHGDDVSGWMDSQYTTEASAWKEQQMLVAVGIIKPGGKVNLDYDAIVKKAKPCTVRVGVERVVDEDGEATWRGRMNAFLPLRDAKVAGNSKRRRDDDEPAEDVFDDDEGDDEEDEPAKPTRSRRSRKAPEPEPEPEDDEEEGEDEPYDPEELEAELEELSLAQLKKRARDEFKITIKRGDDQDSIINAILETLDDEDEEDEPEEDEPEEEPEPPKRSRRAAAKGATRSRARRGSSDEPPF